MPFIIFAAAAMLWSLSALLRVVGIFKRLTRVLFVFASWLVLATAATTTALDLRSVRMASAQATGLDIRVLRRDDWWQLRYSRPGAAFLTANELHVPAGLPVHLTWNGARPPWINDAVCVALRDDGCTLIAEASSSRARFVSLWPPSWRDLNVIAEPPEEFDRWFQNEARVAAPAQGAALFESSGCGYCHVIRGVTEEATQIAPDLTHFASRRTLAGTSLRVKPANLMGWIAHSRGLKRSSRMPDNAVDPRVLHALVPYLESLR